MNYHGQHVLVLGLGQSGLAMTRWLLHRGARVRVADTRSAPPMHGELALLESTLPVELFSGPFLPSLLQGVDIVAVSPGLSPYQDFADLAAAAKHNAIAVVGEIELFAQALNTLRETYRYAPKVLAITGTNGKTTVTRLTGLLCEKSGLRTQVAGNISPSALEVLDDALSSTASSEIDAATLQALPEVWVLELSSFQLHTTASLHADAAALLNISQDHLDWHGDLAHYIEAKARVFGEQTVRVINRDDAAVVQAAAQAPTHAAQSTHIETITFGANEANIPGDFGLLTENGVQWLSTAVATDDDEKKPKRKRNPLNDPNSHQFAGAVRVNRLMPADALQIKGRHNAVNALAALALCRAIDLPLAPLLHALRIYQGEPHRVELITTVAGVQYFDDSKGTNVGATVAALVGLGAQPDQGTSGRKKLWLIAGGEGKGQDFSPLAEPVKDFACAVLLIGRDAPQIRQALADTQTQLIDCTTLESAVDYAAQRAQAGDSVLLSPACASFDMFKNYEHRAQVFVDAVRNVALERGEVMA